MMLHLEAISDEMVTVINDGPIKIEVVSSSCPRANDDTATPSEKNEVVIVRKPKDRSEWTSEEAKRFRLDGQARNIIIRSTPDSIQCKLWGAKTAKEAWKMVQDLCAGSEKTKENKLEVLKLRFQNFKQGPTESLEELDFRFTTLISEMAALGEGSRYSDAEKVKTIIRGLNQEWVHTQNFYYNQGVPNISPTELFSHLAAVNYETKQRESPSAEKSQNVALLTKATPSEKKEDLSPAEENALAVRNMKKFVSKEIERRKAKETLKKHLGSNYHKYKTDSSSLNKQAQQSSETPAVGNDLCFYCQKPGHFKRDCPLLKSKSGEKRRKFKRAMIAEEKKKLQQKIDALCLETSSESSDSDSDTDDTTPVNDFSKEVCGIAIEDMSDEEFCLVSDQVQSSTSGYETDDGIDDLMLVQGELDRFEIALSESHDKLQLAENMTKQSTEKYDSLSIKFENKVAEIVQLTALLTKVTDENSAMSEELAEYKATILTLLAENRELKKKEVNFRSYADACCSVAEVQSYLKTGAHKEGLGAEHDRNHVTLLKKGKAPPKVFVRPSEYQDSKKYPIGNTDVAEKRNHRGKSKVAEKRNNNFVPKNKRSAEKQKVPAEKQRKSDKVAERRNKSSADKPESSKVAENRDQHTLKKGLGFKSQRNQLSHEYKQTQQKYFKEQRKTKPSKVVNFENARTRRTEARKLRRKAVKQFVPRSVLMRTPPLRVDIDSNVQPSFGDQPSDSSARTQVKSVKIKTWVPTGRIFEHVDNFPVMGN